MKTKKEIANCPFCKSSNVSLTYDDLSNHIVCCNTCFAKGPIVLSMESDIKAIELWNKRWI